MARYMPHVAHICIHAWCIHIKYVWHIDYLHTYIYVNAHNPISIQMLCGAHIYKHTWCIRIKYMWHIDIDTHVRTSYVYIWNTCDIQIWHTYMYIWNTCDIQIWHTYIYIWNTCDIRIWHTYICMTYAYAILMTNRNQRRYAQYSTNGEQFQDHITFSIAIPQHSHTTARTHFHAKSFPLSRISYGLTRSKLTMYRLCHFAPQSL